MVGTVARHVAGAVAAWLVCVAEGLLGYLALTAYAMLADVDPGGPLAGPFMVLGAALLGAALVPLVVAPAVVVGDVAASRRGPLGRTLAACLVAVVIVGLYVGGVAAATGTAVADAALAWPLTTASVLCPVVAYASVVHGSRAAALLLARRRRHTTTPPTGPA
ncbi:hypothetical protein GA0070606_5297 [Micromonospora citrea]|uniref:Uncharacterized protein n=1 Tax=Micromonospora citrea TaxID=47855 RepID=A0A1C6VUW8_9ACTN|nr:hypothetical protein [Micromonospora citrea]SCL70113.1 hypothetical protein GA0070606_5297 [Micromonospora citrea]